MSNVDNTVRKAVTLVVVIAVALVILQSLFSVIPGFLFSFVTFEPGASGFDNGEIVDDDTAGALEVSLSTETAVYLGGNSYVDDPTDESVFGNGSWTVAATAEPIESDGFNPDATYTVYAADNETVKVLYESGNWTARYETPAGDTAFVTGNAELTRTPIVAQYNSTADELALYVDGQLVDTDTPDGGINSQDVNFAWIGSIDEVRVVNATIGTGGASDYAAAPTAPLATSNTVAHAPFNDGREDTVYYANGSASFVGDNVRFSDGVADPAIEQGTDYQLSTSPVVISALDGGVLDGAPIVFVEYGGGALGGVVLSIRSTIGAVLQLMAVVVMLVITRSILRNMVLNT